MTTALIGVLFFTVLILILVILLNFAGDKLLPQGDVEIEINGDKDKSISEGAIEPWRRGGKGYILYYRALLRLLKWT